MEASQPIVAIVSSAHPQIVGDLEPAAYSAYKELGRELAKAGWHIAVYASDPNFIEAGVVCGGLAVAPSEGSCVSRATAMAVLTPRCTCPVPDC
jgi:hypothetical protein